jgi:hypothetical protein
MPLDEPVHLGFGSGTLAAGWVGHRPDSLECLVLAFASVSRPLIRSADNRVRRWLRFADGGATV